MENPKPSTAEMEVALAQHFNPRINIVVPNVYWGMGFNHELDLFVLTPGGYGWEVEIKISLSDLKADLKKKHGHRDPRIKYLYFGLPSHLLQHIDLVPERAGVIIVSRHSTRGWYCKKIRAAQPQTPKHIFRTDQRLKLLHLSHLRVWGLKRKLIELKAKESKNGK